MSEWPASLRTTNGMRLPAPVLLRTRWAIYKPDTAVLGTVHEADTAQLPQSMSPVGWVSFLHAGCVCGSEAVGSMLETTLRAPLPWYQPMRRMSMWYAPAVALILKFSVCPAFTLIDVAKPWIVESPAPLTCQSLGGSPGSVFSQAITLVTGGPHGPAALAGGALTRETRPRSTASIKLTTKRRVGTRRPSSPATGICPPPTDGALLVP